MRIAGIDGYTGGWIAVILEGGVFATAQVAWNKCLEALIRDNKIDHAIVDIPIGLASKPEERDTEQAMRDFLTENEGQGWLAARVFNAPCYQALEAENYAQANIINRDILGVGLTQQTFGIMPKIKEAKKVVKNLGQDRIREGHPEISFYILSNHEPLDSKAKARGAVKRLKLLQDLKFDPINLIEHLPERHPAKPDDLLDAAGLAWSATRWKNNEHESFPSTPKKDSKNLEMVVYA